MDLFFGIVAFLWVVLTFPPIIYYLWMAKRKGEYGLKIDFNYQPKVTLIVATYNEASVIVNKLGNIQELDYPDSKLQVIVVDSASNDGTIDLCKKFLAKNNPRFPVELISEKERLGKSHALNVALKHANGDIIATSDADSFWNKDALQVGVSFFADPLVGAITGKESLSNLGKNILTMSEGIYKVFFNTLRQGESSIHSTWMIQGELALYRRSAFKEFEAKPGYSDDHGTALDIISIGYRCVFVPEAVFFDTAATSLRGRLIWKSRRAEHLMTGVIKSLKLKAANKLPIPWRVLLFNFYFYILSPLIFFVSLVATSILYVINFQSLWFLAFFLIPLFIKKSRAFVISYFTSNLALIIGLFPIVTKKRTSTWRKVDEMR